jgi:protein O-mannosyl-transferase
MMPASVRTLLWLTTLIAVCAALYWPSLHSPFLFDDFPNLSALDSIDHLSSWRDLGIYLSQPRNFPGRPIAMLSFLLQKSAWPDHPLPFRLVNIGIHLLNGALVFMLTRCVARYWLSDKVNSNSVEQRILLAATLASAGWLLNPIQISGVVLIVQRMTLLMASFTLLGLLAYLHSLLEIKLPVWRRGTWMALGLGACMGFAILTKENGILLPFYAFALNATVLRKAVGRLPAHLCWLQRLLTWPVMLFVLGYLFWQVPSQWGEHGIRDFTVGERLLTEPRVLVSYLDKIFLPRFGLYGLYHDDFVISHGLFTPWTTGPCLLAILALLALSLVGRHRWPLLSLAILWYLGGQLLESSSVMLEPYFEHRNYMPLAGIMIAFGISIAQIERPRLRHLCMFAASLWLIACSITTALSAQTYSSEDRLAATWAYAQPDSIRAQTYLAERLLRHRQPDRALHIIDTLAIGHPNSSVLAENRVYMLCAMGKLTTNDVSQMNHILQIAPLERGGFEGMATLREMAAGGQCPALDDNTWLRSADILLSNRSYTADGIASGFLHYQKHLWAVKHGNLDMAIHELDEAYKVDPDAEIPRLQANYLVSAGLYDQAIAILRQTNYQHLPLLRRLLVDDRAINAADIAEIQKMKQTATKQQRPELHASKAPSA